MNIIEKENSLSTTDHVGNVIRAGIKGVPWIGSTLDQLLFGVGDELRWKRIESTLKELGEKMEERQIPPESILNSDFEDLLRRVSGELGQSTNEDKRKRFRDLLLNVAPIPSGDNEWESARLASELLKQIDAPGLAIMAAAASEGAFVDSEKKIAILRYPKPQVWPENITNTNGYDQKEVYKLIPYDWAVIEVWLLKLHDLKLISGQMGMNKAWTNFMLTTRGTFLSQWTIDNHENTCNKNDS